jgi:hypothetical protein
MILEKCETGGGQLRRLLQRLFVAPCFQGNVPFAVSARLTIVPARRQPHFS